MGLSLTSAIIGLGMVILGGMFLVLRKRRKAAVALVGVPYGVIYLLLG